MNIQKVEQNASGWEMPVPHGVVVPQLLLALLQHGEEATSVGVHPEDGGHTHPDDADSFADSHDHEQGG